MPLSKLEGDLRLLARDRIGRGELPHIAPNRMWGGPGEGEPCALCEKIIPRAELEVEVEQPVAGSSQTFHFHVLCHSVWQLECLRADYLERHPEAAR